MAVQPWGQQPNQPQHPYGAQPWQPAPSPQSAMRAAHADRERTVDVLKAAYAEGRLTAEEYSQRFDAAHRAQTYGQLAHLVSDLPSGPMPTPQVAPAVAVPQTFLPPPVVYAPPRTNGMAIASLVLGLLCLPSAGMFGIPAVVTGHLAKRQMRETREDGDGMATAGLVIGWLSIGGWALIFLLGVLSMAAGG
ncbi:DUF1707 and DUF4190 domain-containing protein [Kitasatospora sp. NPDC059571]|uniref:DUF1707 and DUF4190 domain-containing protein n=1 Tax=Kitasatospora sp. NPDC059571 TaxID=3346871 RepID=UPI003675E475